MPARRTRSMELIDIPAIAHQTTTSGPKSRSCLSMTFALCRSMDHLCLRVTVGGLVVVPVPAQLAAHVADSFLPSIGSGLISKSVVRHANRMALRLGIPTSARVSS